MCLIRTGDRNPGIGVAAAISRVMKIPAQLWSDKRTPRVTTVKRARKKKS